MKYFFRFLPFIAVIFAFLYFINLDIYNLRFSINLQFLFYSCIILFFVFFFRSLLWKIVLSKFNINIKFNVAVDSHFSTILYKYIPGKVWGVIGKANIISQYGYDLTTCSFISFFLQLIMTATGLIIGGLGIFLLKTIAEFNLLIYPLILFIALLLCFFRKKRYIPYFNSKFIPKKLATLFNKTIPPISDLILLSFMQWLLLGIAYMIFILSVGFNASILPIFLQPLANNIGIISSFTPSGLGVREAVMTAYLLLENISIKDATAISIISRIWFFSIEIFAFVCGIIIHSFIRKKSILY